MSRRGASLLSLFAALVVLAHALWYPMPEPDEPVTAAIVSTTEARLVETVAPTSSSVRLAPTTTAERAAEPTAGPTSTTPPSSPTSDGEQLDWLAIAIRIEDATGTSPTFVDTASDVLLDPRGWTSAGVAIEFDDEAPYLLVLDTPAGVDRRCAPYRTGGQFSCQNGPVVAINLDRWTTAVPSWESGLDDYRRMLVNHEIGHLLGLHHPEVNCDGDGVAPVMAQQSKGTPGCEENAWPRLWEIECLRADLEPIAPGYEASSTPLCGPGGPFFE